MRTTRSEFLLAYLRALAEVRVASYRLATHIAHLRAADAAHVVASVYLVEAFLALPADTDHSLRHLRLDVVAQVFVSRRCGFIAAQRYVVHFLA